LKLISFISAATFSSIFFKSSSLIPVSYTEENEKKKNKMNKKKDKEKDKENKSAQKWKEIRGRTEPKKAAKKESIEKSLRGAVSFSHSVCVFTFSTTFSIIFSCTICSACPLPPLLSGCSITCPSSPMMVRGWPEFVIVTGKEGGEGRGGGRGGGGGGGGGRDEKERKRRGEKIREEKKLSVREKKDREYNNNNNNNNNNTRAPQHTHRHTYRECLSSWLPIELSTTLFLLDTVSTSHPLDLH
jgi:hypothetical protein